MSSREIAELTGKLHHNIMRDATKMLIELYGDREAIKFEDYYIATNGKQNPCFNLPKRKTVILVSGYSVELRARIIDRWTELEWQVQTAAPVLPDFSNPAIAARAWAEQYERRQFAGAGC